MRGSDPASVPVRHDFVTGRSWLNFGSIGGLFGFVIVSGLAIWLLPFHVFNEVLVLPTLQSAYWRRQPWLFGCSAIG
jgi:hypothetical protein